MHVAHNAVHSKDVLPISTSNASVGVVTLRDLKESWIGVCLLSDYMSNKIWIVDSFVRHAGGEAKNSKVSPFLPPDCYNIAVVAGLPLPPPLLSRLRRNTCTLPENHHEGVWGFASNL